MIGYVIPGGSAVTATENPKAKRLLSAGPWMAQPHPQGALLSWKTEDGMPHSASEYGPSRETLDGMIYMPPKELPSFETFFNPSMHGRDDILPVRVVREESVTVVRIIPAYASPKMIMEDNSRGNYATKYGKAVRILLDRVNANPKMKYGEYAKDLFEACRLAIMHTHSRMTRELIADYGIIDDDTAMDFWEGMIHVPKELLQPESVP